MGELLLELLSEEIPARMQRDGLRDLIRQLRDALGNAYLQPTKIDGYVTPRRLSVIATGIPTKQSDFHDERRGPRLGAPEAARAGFARSAGLAVEELTEHDGYYYAEVVRVGRPAVDVLPSVILQAIQETTWPKSMRFPAAPLHWVRPINSIVCLFDGEIVPLSVGQVPVGNTTRGHRLLSPGEIAVDNAADYLAKLEAAHVILDQDRRRDIIAAGLDRLAQKEGVQVKPDPGLLDEVTGLAEFPVVLTGRIDEASMGLPPEVLATAMRTHQKYFTCLKPDGSPAPRFLFVANNKTPDDGETIVAGNERVLKARLADARFFWDQDRKIPLADRVDALKDRVYYEKLGTVYDKVERMERLASNLAAHTKADPTLAARAARLAKADLSTGMVGEFPELQGVMGRYYALNDGEDARIADAIADHYKPLGPNDTCPNSPDSIVVALADKLDALAAFFAIGEKPTGSRDPFALRRAAQGIIRLILENRLRLSLHDAFARAISGRAVEYRGPVFDLLEFVADRLKVHLRDRGVRHDLVAATFIRPSESGIASIRTYDSDLVRLLARVESLQKFLDTEDGANLLIAYRRASNIVEIEEKRDGRSYDEPVDAGCFRQPQEEALYQRLSGMRSTLESFLRQEAFGRVMERLATLRAAVDEFFDKVTVNTDEKVIVDGREVSVRENRLRLLSRIRAVMNQVADFSQIEG